MSEWKELKIDKLPEDILTGEYEFKDAMCNRLTILKYLLDGNTIIYYRKPEPAVIIRKSGGTWVARYDGVDYLHTDPMKDEITEPAFHYYQSDLIVEHWKPISEIQITDEIAKLRPMVVTDCGLYRLIAVDPSDEYSYITMDCDCHKSTLLATVDDLN